MIKKHGGNKKSSSQRHVVETSQEHFGLRIFVEASLAGVRMKRVVVYCGRYCGPLIYGNYHLIQVHSGTPGRALLERL